MNNFILTKNQTMKYDQYAKAAKILRPMKKRLLDIANKSKLPTTRVQQCRLLKSTRENIDKLMFLMDDGLWADNPEGDRTKETFDPKKPNDLFF